jgi:hypothetical protein
MVMKMGFRRTQSIKIVAVAVLVAFALAGCAADGG